MQFVLPKIFILVMILCFSGCFGVSYINQKSGLSSFAAPVIQSMMPSSISTNPKPSLRVTNVPLGSTLKIYGGNNCSTYLEDVVANSNVVDFNLQNSLAVGAYQFSVKYVTVEGEVSDCSAPISPFYYDPIFSTVTMKTTAQTVTEANTTFNVDVLMSPAKLYDVTVKFNLSGTNLVPNTNYSISSNEITIPAGATTAQIPLILFNDGVQKIDGRININLESSNRAQVQFGSQQSTTRSYIQDAHSTFSTISYVGLGGNGGSGACVLLSSGVIKCWGTVGGMDTYSLPTVIDVGVTYNQLSFKSNSGCGITNLGQLKCFASIIGDGNAFSNTTTPYVHAGTYIWTKAFGSATCAIRSNNDLYCWGYNSSGRLGNGNSVNQFSPVQIDSGQGYNSIEIGNHTCAITTAQQVKCWGLNTYGQLGDGTTATRSSPGAVIDGGQTYLKVLVATDFTCGLTTTNKIKCWGRNNYGQLADGTTTDSPSPISVDSSTDYIDLALGVDHVCGITNNNLVKCWGRNSNSQIGNGSTTNALSATQVDVGTTFSKIFLNSTFTCGIQLGTGTLKCWGLIPGYNTVLSTPTIMDTTLAFSNIFSDNTNILGVTTSGELFFQDYSSAGTGLYGTGYNITPTKQDPEKTFSVVSGACRIETNGKLFCASYSDGTTTQYLVHIPVDPTHAYTRVSSNTLDACAIRSDGKLFCWGVSGVTGDGTTNPRYSPVAIDSNNTYSEVSVGSVGATCAIRTTGELYCWGTNTEGTVGDGTTTFRASPVLVDSGTSYEKISVTYQACGIVKTTGVLKCWGDGFRGKVGHNSQTDQLVPLVIDAGTSYKDVKTIDQHTCGVTVGGALKCWGRNFWNEIGDGGGGNRLLPVHIDTLTTFESVSEGITEYTCAIVVGGAVKCWGLGTAGRAGQASSTSISTPQTVVGLPAMVSLYAGYIRGCGLDQSGIQWCWGGAEFQVEYLNTNPFPRFKVRNMRIEQN